MKISRRGSSANFGKTSISLESPAFGWDSKGQIVTIKQRQVRDFSTVANHDYVVSMSLGEVAALLVALSDAAHNEPTAFEQGMPGALKSITHLQAVLAGVTRA